jgi:hypothetical protein
MAVRLVHFSSPWGVHLAMLRRTAASSASVSTRFTSVNQFRGQGTGQWARIAGRTRFAPRIRRQARLDQDHSSARSGPGGRMASISISTRSTHNPIYLRNR